MATHPHKTRAKTNAHDSLLKLLDEAKASCTAVGTALHVAQDPVAAQAALFALNAQIGNARALHDINPIQPTETDSRDSAAELADLSTQTADLKAAIDSAVSTADAAKAVVDPITATSSTPSPTPFTSSPTIRARTPFDDLDSDLAQETRALRQQLADVMAAERQQASYERAAFTAQTSALDDRMARLEDMISRLSSGPQGDPNQAMLATQANMQLAGATLRANVSAAARLKELECALANGGHPPSQVAAAAPGARFWSKSHYANLVSTGSLTKQNATWSSTTFTLNSGGARPVRIQFNKASLMMAYDFKFGHDNDNSGIGLEHIIPLRAGQSAQPLTPAELDSFDSYRIASLTTDDTLRLSELPNQVTGPLPTLPIINGADFLARLEGLQRFLSYMYDQSADPQPLTLNPGEQVPACTLTQGLSAVARAVATIIAEKGELGPGPGLEALRIGANKAISDFSVSLRVTASERANSLAPPSLSDRLAFRAQLASHLQTAFNPLLERLFGVYDPTFRNLLLAPSSATSAPSTSSSTSPPTTRDILRSVPSQPRHPCVSGMIYNECHRPECRYEHDASKLPATSLTTLLHNLGSLLKGRSLPASSEGQGGPRA